MLRSTPALILSAIALFAAAPAFADDVPPSPGAVAQVDAKANKAEAQVQLDQAAIQKDNEALAGQRDKLDQHRALKTYHSVRGEHVKAAGEAVKAGASHVAIGAKKVETKVDEKILTHDAKTQDKVEAHQADVHEEAATSTETAPAQ